MGEHLSDLETRKAFLRKILKAHNMKNNSHVTISKLRIC